MNSVRDSARGETFHPGERALQERTGVREQMATFEGRVIRPELPEQHRAFYAQLPFVLLGALDRDGFPWATIAVGTPGFVSSPNAHELRIAWPRAPGDPAADAIGVGSDLALLGIELATRRRNRVNGTVLALTPEVLSVRVKQSFGNCPQYIQAREVAAIRERARPDQLDGPAKAETSVPGAEGAVLSARAVQLVTAADTLFIASATPPSAASAADSSRGVDVSHRGGKPGFVRVRRTSQGSELLFPDFRGNFFFNTLGNLALLPRAGLLFIDFATGDVLTLTGHAEVLWDGPELEAFAGAERLVRVVVQRSVWLAPVPLRFGRPSYARQLANTGYWPA
jgi:predicted pyridoxine 5'-phosphate oxidase superfamily flavin-nucleotide-binding protein